MARVTLADVPKEPHEVEDYLAALFRAAGWCVEPAVVLREDGVELLEIDARAVQLGQAGKRLVLSEAKSGNWGAPDLFTLLGWKSFLNADSAVFGSTKLDGEVPAPLRRHAASAGVTIIYLGALETTQAHFVAAGLGEPLAFEVGLWRLAAMVERRYREEITRLAKASPGQQGSHALRNEYRLVGEQVHFFDDPVEQAAALYDAYDSTRRLTLSLAYELDGRPFTDGAQGGTSERLRKALRTGSDLCLHCSMWIEYRRRLAILRAATELILDQGRPGTPALMFRETFATGIDWLRTQPTFYRYPALWEQFCWTWGGFLLLDRLGEEYAQLSRASGVPEREVPQALEALDRIFPSGKSWFVTPGPTRAKRLLLFPHHFHGIGAFRRRLSGWAIPQSSPSDHTGTDVVGWNNVAVSLIGTKDP